MDKLTLDEFAKRVEKCNEYKIKYIAEMLVCHNELLGALEPAERPSLLTRIRWKLERARDAWLVLTGKADIGGDY